MQYVLVFDTDLNGQKLHETLCKAIHEADAEAIIQLQDTTNDIYVVTAVEPANACIKAYREFHELG